MLESETFGDHLLDQNQGLIGVALFEDEQGRGIFEYDRPSSFSSQYGDERVTEVGRYLDATLEAVLRNAAD